ncbi:hypothetical protein C8T65DRAFT_834249 [Cerioporus squamosus]|nr:hypothetical protein C8T65DRAFT_834249 [Cerioporus squamosus]
MVRVKLHRLRHMQEPSPIMVHVDATRSSKRESRAVRGGSLLINIRYVPKRLERLYFFYDSTISRHGHASLSLEPFEKERVYKPYTVTFDATALLLAFLGESSNTERALEHDLEALCWVIVHAVYKHGLANTSPRSEEHRCLQNEFCSLYSATSIEELISLRGDALRPSLQRKDPDARFRGIRALLQYAEGYMRLSPALWTSCGFSLGRPSHDSCHPQLVRPEFRA